MKRNIALILVLVMVAGLCACGGGTASSGGGSETPASSAASSESAAPASSSEAAPAASSSEEVAPAVEDNRYMKLSPQLNETLSGLRPTYIAGYGNVSQMMFGNLLRYDLDTKEYVPALAEVTVSEDGLTYTATLKDGMEFHDGSPITADDVIFTYTNTICLASGRVNKLTNIVGYEDFAGTWTEVWGHDSIPEIPGIKKIDDKTVAFTLSQKNSLFIEAMANGCFGILPAAYFIGKSEQEVADYWSNPVGSGAYYVAETNYPNYIVLKAWEKYYDPSGIPQVLCTYYADNEALYAAAMAGDYDLLTGLEEETANNIMSQNPDITGVPTVSSYRRWFMLNCSGVAKDGQAHPSLMNQRVRQALNLIVDKNAIAQLYGSMATPLTSMINPAKDEYNKDLPTWERDVEKGKQILDEEGFRYDIPIRLFSNYGDQITADFCELIVQQFAEAGVTVEYTIDTNWQAYLPYGDYDWRYAGGQSSMPIELFSDTVYSALGTTTKVNFPMEEDWVEPYLTERYDNLVNAYKASSDPAEQKELLDQIQANAYEDMFEIPLYSLNRYNLVNSAHVAGIPMWSADDEEVADRKFSQWHFVD